MKAMMMVVGLFLYTERADGLQLFVPDEFLPVYHGYIQYYVSNVGGNEFYPSWNIEYQDNPAGQLVTWDCWYDIEGPYQDFTLCFSCDDTWQWVTHTVMESPFQVYPPFPSYFDLDLSNMMNCLPAVHDLQLRTVPGGFVLEWGPVYHANGYRVLMLESPEQSLETATILAETGSTEVRIPFLPATRRFFRVVALHP